MPLKHFTETLLVWILGAVTVVTGVFIATLPGLPAGLLPSLVLLVLTLAYPFAMYPMLKRNRADYLFRMLHFAPAVMVGIWLVLQMLTIRFSFAAHVLRGYTWGWTFPAVLLTLVLLAAFCLHVIRRRVPRLTGLTLLLLLFLVFGLTARGSPLQGKMAALLWRAGPAASSSASSMELAVVPTFIGGLSSSSVPGATDPLHWNATHPRQTHAVKKMSRLPRAGPRIDLLIVSLLAGYCAVLHGRAQRRLAVAVA